MYLTATIFTDDPLVAGITVVKAQHINELRQAINNLRAVAGLAPALWTDATLLQYIGLIRVVDIQELRRYLDEAIIKLGYISTPYTDPGLTTGYIIRKIHIDELRQRVKAVTG
jgi:hypothetical protein